MAQQQPCRSSLLDQLRTGTDWFDIIVIGGGITGAGIAREAAGSGLKTLLVEQRDFAWGTSSRSSKMVHGGLRYLGSGQFGLTQAAVRERERLLKEAPGLINPLSFVMPHFRKQFPGPRLFGLLLWLYDRMAGQHSRRRLTATETLQWVPGLSRTGLAAGNVFVDAVTDDARMVQRTLEEARRDGASCLNYVKASRVLRQDGRARGVALQDQADGNSAEFIAHADVVINATGAWAGQLQASAVGLRPLRGSHLVLRHDALPVSCAVSLLHPEDGRPVFAFPWHGTTVLGTTDLDHQLDLDQEPHITRPEADYLLKIAATLFPDHPIQPSDVVSSWAGVRPVVSSGNGKAPSRENREHVIWDDQGLVSVAGGKLTTFRLIARQVLQHSRAYLPALGLRDARLPVFTATAPPPCPPNLDATTWQRLAGYYGPALDQVLASGPLTPIEGSDTLWAELIWAAQYADVVHLDDLLLRRTRLGLTLPDGGQGLLEQIHEHCGPALSWNDATWQAEINRYRELWQNGYAPPANLIDAESPSP